MCKQKFGSFHFQLEAKYQPMRTLLKRHWYQNNKGLTTNLYCSVSRSKSTFKGNNPICGRARFTWHLIWLFNMQSERIGALCLASNVFIASNTPHVSQNKRTQSPNRKTMTNQRLGFDKAGAKSWDRLWSFVVANGSSPIRFWLQQVSQSKQTRCPNCRTMSNHTLGFDKNE